MDSIRLIKQHESCRLDLYRDTQGVATIGWGTKIERITQAEADYLFENRYQQAKKEAGKFSFYDELNEPRRAVIEYMVYTMGIGRFKGLRQVVKALQSGDYQEASKQMLYNTDGTRLSQWAQRAGHIAMDLAKIMDTGQWLK